MKKFVSEMTENKNCSVKNMFHEKLDRWTNELRKSIELLDALLMHGRDPSKMTLTKKCSTRLTEFKKSKCLF